MKIRNSPRGGLAHRFATIVVDNVDHVLAFLDDTGDPAATAERFRRLLVRMHPFDATQTAALAALHPSTSVRRALASALGAPLRVVGDDLVLEHLARDRDLEVRSAASRACDARRRR